MNRRELLAGVIGAAGCAALPAATSHVASPLTVWRFSEVTRYWHLYWPTEPIYHRYFLQVLGRPIMVDFKTFCDYLNWSRLMYRDDGSIPERFFTDIAHSGEVEYVA